jgi:hypothetical protein
MQLAILMPAQNCKMVCFAEELYACMQFDRLLTEQYTATVNMQDTDEARSTRASEDSMVQDLKWLGLDWDEVRLVAIYKKLSILLIIASSLKQF